MTDPARVEAIAAFYDEALEYGTDDVPRLMDAVRFLLDEVQRIRGGRSRPDDTGLPEDTVSDVRSTALREPEDDPLEVDVIAGRLVISIGVRTLAFAAQHRDDPHAIRITDPLVAAREVARELDRADEDGTTEVHKLLDKAVFDAWENGGDGFDFE